MKLLFTIELELGMSPHDFAELDPKHFKIEMVSYNQRLRKYKITSDKLKYLVEAIIVFCYNDDIEALKHLHKIQCMRGELVAAGGK